jgi:uroporphyrinogen-III synthase
MCAKNRSMPERSALAFAGLTVLSFESRRAAEIAELIRRHAGEPVSAPSMREVPLEENRTSIELLEALEAGTVDVVLLLTGVGTRALVASLTDHCPPERFAELLGRTVVVARGPKPVAALRELGLTPNVTVPEPNTWREILRTLDERVPLGGRRVAVQEYGRTNPELLDGLAARGAEVIRVPVYRWALPEDVEPLRAAIRRLAAGEIDVVLFTSARQVDHVMRIAEDSGLADAVLRSSQRCVVASIGPVCSESLTAHGWQVDLEPEHPKMGHLVSCVAKRSREILEAKKGAGG